LAQMLVTNKVLRKLELEGNLLGPQSARAFGKSLKKNSTLRVLDLESNQLTQDGQDMQGIYDFVKCLFKNKSLLSLNLGNNNMDEKCGELFEEATRYNTTLIDFEFGFNNFTLNDVSNSSP
jgi:Ran GTPase-activating protein (RanGAP) involved in mRNA processing and transport